MTTRSILGLVYTIHGINSMGVETSDILEQYGFSLDNLNPFAQIDVAQELQLLMDIAKRVDDPSCGLMLGEKFGLAGYGPFSLMLMTSPTAFDACKTGIKYQELTYLYAHLSLNMTHNNTALELYPCTLPDEIRDFLIDRDLSGTYQLLKGIIINMGDDINLEELWVPHGANNQQAFEAIFQCEIKFNKPFGKLIMHNADFSRTFPQSNALACNLYKAQCDQLIEARATQLHGLKEKVRQYLNLFEYQFPTLLEVAALFSIPDRTLRRQLSKESTSYQKILNAVRYQRACHLLKHSKISIESISEKLGYSEPSAFNHAFIKWSGHTPRSFRQNPSPAFTTPT